QVSVALSIIRAESSTPLTIRSYPELAELATVRGLPQLRGSAATLGALPSALGSVGNSAGTTAAMLMHHYAPRHALVGAMIRDAISGSGAPAPQSPAPVAPTRGSGFAGFG